MLLIGLETWVSSLFLRFFNGFNSVRENGESNIVDDCEIGLLQLHLV